MAQTSTTAAANIASMHGLGVVCGLTAGAWLGAAEAPTKLVAADLSPFSISLCMVAGVFVARWTVPTLLKGTGPVFADLARKPHLILWAILAGCLWAVGNTLTVFAIRNVGLTIAFPLWNTNGLIGLFWGWLLFNELRGSSVKNRLKVILGATAILLAAVVLGYSSMHGGTASSRHPGTGVLAAIGASFMWGTMYVPYRKAYLSGINPLSFVTAFTVGELGLMAALAVGLSGGVYALAANLALGRHFLFWLFLGGFCWVIGDLFQQYATKYVGIGRGIPLSNTNQLWGLAWGALVFGELRGADSLHRLMVVAGSLVMILGALAISTAVASSGEHLSTDAALLRECDRYHLDYDKTRAAQLGIDLEPDSGKRRLWIDFVIVTVACAIFAWLARGVQVPPLRMDPRWAAVLGVFLALSFVGCGALLWRRTRFF